MAPATPTKLVAHTVISIIIFHREFIILVVLNDKLNLGSCIINQGSDSILSLLGPLKFLHRIAERFL